MSSSNAFEDMKADYAKRMARPVRLFPQYEGLTHYEVQSRLKQQIAEDATAYQRALRLGDSALMAQLDQTWMPYTEELHWALEWEYQERWRQDPHRSGHPGLDAAHRASTYLLTCDDLGFVISVGEWRNKVHEGRRFRGVTGRNMNYIDSGCSSVIGMSAYFILLAIVKFLWLPALILIAYLLLR